MIEATRNYVCVRIDSYESEEAQKIVRGYLNGTFQNTAFCLLSPDGEDRLSRSHRSPTHIFRGGLVSSLDEIAAKYQVKGEASEAAVPDFPNFRLGLNVASADQRVLVLVTGTEAELKTARESLRSVSNDAEVMGRFHYDFESDAGTWTEALTGDESVSQIKIIVPDPYGQSGKVVKSLPLDTRAEDLKKALLAANETFAETTEKKNYSTHVKEGRSQGIEWSMPMAFGEDRDGDGKIDERRGRR